jgi:hypothetical protein
MAAFTMIPTSWYAHHLIPVRLKMGASICCAEAEADTQFTIFDLSALKKQCLIS